MKRKLLSLAVALLCSVATWAADLPTSGSGQFYLKNVGTGTFLKGDSYWGTKAVVWDDPYYITLTYMNDGVYTLQSQQNNGGNKQYFTSDADLYVDGVSCEMTFTEVDAVNHYYTINNGTGNLYAMEQLEDGATLYKVMAGDVSTDYAKWQIFSKAELIAALSNATSSVPVDASFYIKDAGIDVKSVNESNWTKTNVVLAGGGNAGHNGESYNTTSFSISQTLSDLPHGKYKVTCNGYYRWNSGTDNNNQAAISAHASGTEVLNAKFYAGTKEISLMSVAGDADAITFCTAQGWDDNTPNQQWQAAACFTKGYYLNTIDDVIVTSGSLEIGVKKTTQAGTDWAVFDNFKLYYYGNAVEVYDPDAFTSNSSATADKWYKFSVTSAGWYRISSSAAATLNYTQDDSDDADETASKTFTAGGYTFMNLTTGSFYFKSSATSTIKIEAISSSVLQNGDVVTDVFIANPSFETGDLSDWTNQNNAFSIKSESDLGNKVGTYYAFVNNNNTRSLSQTVSHLPEGNYVLSVNAKIVHSNTSYGTSTINMGSNSTPIPCDLDAATYYVAYEASDDASASISFSKNGVYGYRYFDNFTLTYYTELPAVSGVDDLLASAMAGDVRAALDAANTAYTGSKTAANYNALQTAIVNAKTSIAAFAANTGTDADWTGVIQNPSFEAGGGSTTGWTYTPSNDDGAKLNSNATYTMSGIDGSYLFNIWATGNPISQTLKNLPAGNYKLTAVMGTDAGATFRLKMGDNTGIASSDSKGTGVTVTVYAKLTAKGDLTISADAGGSMWYKVDNFQLTYSPTLPASMSAAGMTAIDGKMNSTVESTQESTMSAYDATSGQTIGNMVAAQAAIYAAHLSVAEYTEIATIKSNYDTKAATLTTKGQAAYTTATTDGSGATTKYNAGTYETASEAETAYRADYVTAIKAQDEDNADMTDLIVNPSFEYGYNLNPATGWTVSVAQGGGTNPTKRYKTDNDGGLGEGGGSVRFFNWTPSAGKVTVGQTIADLEPGTYKLSAYVVSYSGNVVTLKAGETSNSVTLTDGNTTLVDVNFTQASAGSLSIEFSQTGTWFELDNFHLTLLESYYANDADYAALNAAIATGEAKTLGFETGDYAPYNNIDAITALNAAKDIDPESSNTKTSVQTATTNLTGATWTANDASVNAIYNSNMANTDGINPKGWRREADTWGTQVTSTGETSHDFSTTSNNTAWYYNNWDAAKSSYYGDTGLYTMPLKANTMYEFKVKYCSQGTGDGGGVVSSYKATVQKGEETAVLNEFELGANKTQAFEERKVYFMTTNAGDYVLTLTNVGNIFFTDVSIKKVADQTLALPSATQYAAGTYPAVELGRTFTTTNWATVCVPFVFDKSNFEVKELSDITVTGDHISIKLDDASTIKAGKPYLVKAMADDAKIAATDVEMPGESVQNTSIKKGDYTVSFVGTYEGESLTSANKNAWVVSQNQLWNVDSNVTVGAYRAYFTVTGTSVKALVFGDEETGINNLNVDDDLNKNEVIYNLAGQRVQKAVKGLYIKNGKKVVIK